MSAARSRSLDGVRGLAIGLVCLAHIGNGDKWPFRFGGLSGVTLFFVLSGYLITTLLLKEKDGTGRISLWRFWARRAIRLLPALVVFLAIMPVIMFLTDDPRLTNYPRQALTALIYTSNIARVNGQDLGVLNHLWSLAVEEQFYVLWPIVFILLVTVAKRHAGEVVLAVAVMASFYSLFAQGGVIRLYVATDTNVFALLCGCALAFAMHRWAHGPLHLNPTIPALVFVALSAVPGRTTALEPALYRPFSVVYALVGVWMIAASVGNKSWFLGSRPMVYLGTISYALYLWHQGLITSMIHQPSTPGSRSLLILLAVVVASLSWVLVERPANRLRHLLPIDQKRPRPEPAEKPPALRTDA